MRAKTAMVKTKKQIKLKLRIPNVILDARNAKPDLLQELAKGLENLDAHIRLLGHKSKQINLKSVFSVEEALEEAHIWVILGDKKPIEFNMLTERGIVPVAHCDLDSKLQDYNAPAEEGNAFLFSKTNAWSVYGSVVRALENFNFSYDWKNLCSEVKSLTN